MIDSSIKNKLCIGITYHNEGTLIQRCLNSIPINYIGHGLLEVIIHDDASAENVAYFIREDYLAKITIIHSKENIGPSHARNRILQHCNSEFIRYIDSDDEFGENFFEHLFAENPTWTSNTLYVNNVLVNYSERKELISFQENISLDTFRNLVFNAWVPSNSVMLPTELCRQLEGFNSQLSQAEDVDFFYRASYRVDHVSKLDSRIINIVNTRPNSHSSSNYQKNREQLLEVVNTNIKKFGVQNELLLAKYNLSLSIGYTFSLFRGLLSIWQIRRFKLHLVNGINDKDKYYLEKFGPLVYYVLKIGNSRLKKSLLGKTNDR